MRLVPLLVAAVLLGAAVPAPAQEHQAAEFAEARAGDLTVSAAWAKATLPNQKTAAAYLTVFNAGSVPDRLVSASSPLAGRVEIHSMAVVDDVMTMRPVPEGLEVPAGGSVALAPGGGFHLMLVEVSGPLVEGATAPLTLTFERAGRLDLTLPVRGAGAGDHKGHGG